MLGASIVQRGKGDSFVDVGRKMEKCGDGVLCKVGDSQVGYLIG